ncbi:MAG TPA: GatB/YqeY domain-containing protein [Pyrinomonadaceae bacterium]|nr:GatB/YqeY domain-containing protein [Pyrinomonadaceae bacterium]
MGIEQRISDDLAAAMKSKDAARTSTLRLVKAQLKNKQIEKGAPLSDDEVNRLLSSMVKQRRDSIEQYTAAGRHELAEKEKNEIAIIEGYLPKVASESEIIAAVDAAINETGASSIKDIGQVMKAALSKLSEFTIDGRTVNQIVRSKLENK